MAGVKADQFDVVVCEAPRSTVALTSRCVGSLRRSLLHGVRIHTFPEGEISELLVGLMGTINALRLKEIERKTRRGFQGGHTLRSA